MGDGRYGHRPTATAVCDGFSFTDKLCEVSDLVGLLEVSESPKSRIIPEEECHERHRGWHGRRGSLPRTND
jgi:hypothetical protein